MTTRASTTKGNPAPATTTIDPNLARVLGPDAAQLPPELAERVAEALRASAAPAANTPSQPNAHCQMPWPYLHSTVRAHRRAADLQRASIAALALGRLLQRDAELQEFNEWDEDVPPFSRSMRSGLHQALAIALNQVEACAEEIYSQAATEAGE